MPNSAVSAVPTPSAPRRLLLLGCSKAKTTHEGLIPALQRYDGPVFRVLRRYLRQAPDDVLPVYVLSAEFGLISADHPTPNYERRMTPERARELQPEVSSILSQILPIDRAAMLNETDVLVVLGRDYLSALDGFSESRRAFLLSRVMGGSQGKKLAALHDWLYGTPPKAVSRSHTLGPARSFRGVEITLSRDDVLEVARHGLREQVRGATDLTAWFVVVDGQRVAPKWLVSQATGIPVGRFTTSDALSLVARFGIEAERI